jgi:hypothetical protein
VVGQRGTQPGRTLGQQRIAVGRGEEPVPALRVPGQEVQPVADVGQHPVDVEHGHRAFGRLDVG